jgi:endo-1,4-beta-xylanase
VKKADPQFFLIVFFSISVVCSAQTLREAADETGMLIGAAINVKYLSESAYTSTVAREYNMVEAENEMKWTAIRPSEGAFDFSAGDQIVGFAQSHGMKVRGHNLLWHLYNPDWLAKGDYTSPQLTHLMQDHITKVVTHYRGKIFAWDVMNEAMDEHGQLRHSIWYDKPGIGMAGKGTAYIEQAFRWAHAADPDALLFYNDAEAEAINAHSDAIYAMVKDFRQRGVPINGIGLQMHILNLDPDVKSIEKNIHRFVKLGMQVHITEMDVAVPVNADGKVKNPEDLQKQANIYAQIAKACMKNAGCTALQTWGFTDKYSWIGWFTKHTKGDALPFDRQYQPKPAYTAVREVFSHSAKQRKPASNSLPRNSPRH